MTGPERAEVRGRGKDGVGGGVEHEGEDGWRARVDGVNSHDKMIGAWLQQKVQTGN